ncbi:MAG: hypothetical protein Q9160_001014 [Pyrenula sp. 1 TL-2023]
MLICAPREPFRLIEDAELPKLEADHEVLIHIDSIGLNPIDWKSPAFGFGLPSLPCVLGRDFSGTIVKLAENQEISKRQLQPGDVVLGVSTDYRDSRKAAFQQYAVASDFNVCRVPSRLQTLTPILPAIGVAFVTAALSLGVCLGLDFAATDPPGCDLYRLVRTLDRNNLPEDIREECFDVLPEHERIRSGDWLAVWGASSTVGFFTVQLAKRAGLRVIAIADLTKHGSKLLETDADLLIHRDNPEEAVKIIRSVTAGQNLRYGVDTVGKETAQLLQHSIKSNAVDQNSTRHLVCLVGSPTFAPEQSVVYHKVPIKLFHESSAVGWALVTWLEDLLLEKLILPNVEVHSSRGLASINEALLRLQDGEMSGQRIVVKV